MRANLFVDFGALGETDESIYPCQGRQRENCRVIEDDLAFRATTGLSFAWRSLSGLFDLTLPSHLLKKTTTKHGFSDLPLELVFRGDKSAKKIISPIFITCSLAFASPAFAEPIILVFDVDRAIKQSKAGRSMASQLEEQVAKVRADEGDIFKGLQSEARS